MLIFGYVRDCWS